MEIYKHIVSVFWKVYWEKLYFKQPAPIPTPNLPGTKYAVLEWAMFAFL